PPASTLVPYTTLFRSLVGWPVPQRLVIGATLSVCSTMVLLKFLQDRGEVNSPHGRVIVGIALVGDLAVVAMIVLLPALNPTATRSEEHTSELQSPDPL